MSGKGIQAEVKIISLKAFGDERGFFRELYREQNNNEWGMSSPFVQSNHSRSAQYVLRGLHYQLQHPQGKLVTVLRGKALDIVADIRQGSPTFGQWIAQELSDTNHIQMYIPPGFAHGIVMLSEVVDLLYQCTDYYHPEDEYSVAWNDPQLNIDWRVTQPILSAKDQQAPCLSDLLSHQLPVYSLEEA